MFSDFLQYLVRSRSCFVCQHFRCQFDRYNFVDKVDKGTCMINYKYDPYKEESWCKGTYFTIDNEVKAILNNK